MLVLSQWLTAETLLTNSLHPSTCQFNKISLSSCTCSFTTWLFQGGHGDGEIPPQVTPPSTRTVEISLSYLQPLSQRLLVMMLAPQGYLTREDPKRVPVVHLWPDVVQQGRKNPTLRNSPSVVATCSFDHKIISHNISSHTLLASYHHTPCIIHHASSTHSLSKEGFTPATVRARVIR